MKRLANLKNIHSESTSSRQSTSVGSLRSKKLGIVKNNPYPLTRDHSDNTINGHSSAVPISPISAHSRSRQSSFSNRRVSTTPSQDLASVNGLPPKSRAPTLATTNETAHSDTGKSGAGTNNTAARTEGDRDSTFSSPAPSVRSMTTTFTTMQSTTPITTIPASQNHIPANAVYSLTQPVSAVPAHLAPHSHPATYHTVTANNNLTDDASILTLASSSKRRRRNSLDTNASIRALAPASMFGGSRESLPLSVLSAVHPRDTYNTTATDRDNASLRDTASIHYPRSISAMNAERASLISASGVTAPALTSERNSYMSSKPAGDGASVRSGLLGSTGAGDRDRSLYHARNDSLGGISITRERHKDALPQDYYFKEKKDEKEMVTAPTSPIPAANF